MSDLQKNTIRSIFNSGNTHCDHVIIKSEVFSYDNEFCMYDYADIILKGGKKMIFYDTRIGDTRVSICECNGDRELYYVTEMTKDFEINVPIEGTRKSCIEYVIERLTQHYNSELAKFVDNIIERSN